MYRIAIKHQSSYMPQLLLLLAGHVVFYSPFDWMILQASASMVAGS